MCNFFNPLEFNIVKTSDAVQHFGGRRQVAEALGVTRQAVSKWGKYVAEGSAYKLQHITKGKLKVIEKAYENKYAKN
jgi:DNA-binding transcriptional regulator YdaS (Cro superfamily)